MEAMIHKYFDNLVINPVALHNAFPKLSRKTGIVVQPGSIFGPGYDIHYYTYKKPPPHWQRHRSREYECSPAQPHFSRWQYPIGAGAVRTILKLSQKEINKLQDGTIMITFKHTSQVLFNKGTILTIGRITCCDRLLKCKCPPSQIHPNPRTHDMPDGWWNNTERRRRKIVIESNERCCALRSNGSRCTRRKKDGNEKFCGTHIKGTPHGIWD